MNPLPLLLLCVLTARAEDKARVITDDDIVVRVSWNEAILRRMAGLPLDARQTRMLAVLEREGRPVEPFPEGSPERENAARAERDSIAAQRALAGWDRKTLTPILERQKTTINTLWPLTPGGGASPPPPPPEVVQPPPGQSRGEPSDQRAEPEAEPAQGLFEGAPAALLVPTAGGESASGAPPPTDAAVAQASRQAAKALAGAGPGVFGPERKDDLAGNAAGSTRTPRAGNPGARPDGAGQPETTGSRTPRATQTSAGPDAADGPRRQSAPKGEPIEGYPIPETKQFRAPTRSTPEPPSPFAKPAASAPSESNLGAGGVQTRQRRGSKKAEASAESGAEGAETEISPEQLDALREIQAMLAEASGYDPLDSQALSDDAGMLEDAGPIKVDDIDVAALREQIDQILLMAGRQGLTLSEKEVIYEAARNLGLSSSQVQRIIRALRLSEPPSPRLRERAWWQRLLATLRREWRKLNARLHGRSRRRL